MVQNTHCSPCKPYKVVHEDSTMLYTGTLCISGGRIFRSCILNTSVMIRASIIVSKSGRAIAVRQAVTTRHEYNSSRTKKQKHQYASI